MSAPSDRPRGRRGRRITGVVSAAALLVSLLPGVAAAQELPSTDDPRVGLDAGYLPESDDAPGEASLGVDHLQWVQKPEPFYDGDTPPAGFGGIAQANSDLAFSGDLAFMGSYMGVTIYDISEPSEADVAATIVCPGGQGDLSIHGDLLFVSVEEARARVDCTLDAEATPFRGVRIFDVSDLEDIQQVAAVQTCRGSHTHTLVPGGDSVYVYVSGTSAPRTDQPIATELGCFTGPGFLPLQGDLDARWRIDVIEVPLAAPEDAAVVGGPRLFADEDGNVDGLQNSPPAPTHPSGGPWSPAPITDACHDITAYPALGLAAGACEGNGILIDISDPANPTRVADVADPNFAYWHSATFNDDGTSVVFTDEWGGGTGARCRATDQLNWGANAIFDLVDNGDGTYGLELASYYKLDAAQTDQENCVAHNGNLLPHPTRDLMVQAWYQGGMSIWDFTDTSDPYEIAYFDRGPVDEESLVLAGFWSTYFHNGYIYGSEILRGFDVFELTATDDLSQAEIDIIGAYRSDETNAQLQPRFGDGPPPGPTPPPASDNPACDAVEPVSFPDVAGPPHGANVGCIAGYGIAQGRADGNYVPLGDVRRDQMASFIVRTLQVAGADVPTNPQADFSDVSGGPHATAIRQLADLGIVQGFGDGSYRPSATVTRAQMASFIIRALEHALDRDLAPTGAGPFTDIGGVHADNIRVANELEIAFGVTTTRYRPELDVRRDQMGSFIARSLRVLDAEGLTLTPLP